LILKILLTLLGLEFQKKCVIDREVKDTTQYVQCTYMHMNLNQIDDQSNFFNRHAIEVPQQGAALLWERKLF
jgi:hypothetical protein